jgi:hypothetical protein
MQLPLVRPKWLQTKQRGKLVRYPLQVFLSRALSGTFLAAPLGRQPSGLHSATPSPCCGEKAASGGPTGGAQRQAVSSAADPYPGSGAFFTLDLGSGEGFFRIPDL